MSAGRGDPDVELLHPATDVADPELSIVIPALNEELTIADFVAWCHAGMKAAGVVGEILIVDSGSDRTTELALAGGARVLRTPKRGLGRAYIDALPFVRGRYVLMGDCDCTYDFRELAPFVEKFRGGAEFVMGGTDRDFSHVTQTGFFVAVKGSAQTTIIFAGDRWSDFAGNGAGYNQWMPLSFSGRTPRMESLTHWSINAATGAWSVDPRNNYVLNPSFEADRVAMTTPAGWTTSNGSNVQTPHGPGRWSWQLTGTSSLSQTIANVPNGTYTLSAWVRPGSAGAQLAARGFGGTDKTTSLAASSSWTNVSITDIGVSNGQCQVSVTTSGQTVLVDDFVLSRQ